MQSGQFRNYQILITYKILGNFVEFHCLSTDLLLQPSIFYVTFLQVSNFHMPVKWNNLFSVCFFLHEQFNFKTAPQGNMYMYSYFYAILQNKQLVDLVWATLKFCWRHVLIFKWYDLYAYILSSINIKLALFNQTSNSVNF